MRSSLRFGFFKNSAFALMLTAFFTACEEIPPTIGECQTARRVLIEEFTGIRCVNCPIGSEKVEQLIQQYGDKVIPISIHSGFFSQPQYPQSTQDFTTTDGSALDAMLGPVTAYPAACINRKLFSDESQRPLGLSSWSGYIASELCRAPIASVEPTALYNATSRELTVSVEIAPTSTDVIAEPIGLTVLITEDGIRSAQLTPDGLDSNYIHKHVLRDVITDAVGAAVHAGGTAIQSRRLQYNYTLPALWVAENCHVVAFIHYQNNNSKHDVLQASECKVVE